MLDSAAKTSLSDNTATDMLTDLVGRSAVEAALTQTGMAGPALDQPFLTTRETSSSSSPMAGPRGALRRRGQARRRALLASTVDRAPLPAVDEAGAWTAPRDVDHLEYFASASDLCRAYASLAALAHQPGLAPIGQVLSLNDDGLQLDPAQWKTTWFKGGSEPGRITLAFLATTRSGHSYVVTVLAQVRRSPSTRPRRSGHSFGGQGSVHPGGTRLISVAASGAQPWGWRTNSPSPGTLTIMPWPFRISRARAATRCETW